MEVPLEVDAQLILSVKLEDLRGEDINCLIEQDSLRRALLVSSVVHDISLN